MRNEGRTIGIAAEVSKETADKVEYLAESISDLLEKLEGD